MEKEIKKSTLICSIDEITTVADLAKEIGYAVKRARMVNPEINPEDIHLNIEQRDGQSLLYAVWTSTQTDVDSKLSETEIAVELEICKAIENEQTEVMFDCDYSSEKSFAVTRTVTRLYHSEPGRIVYGTPVFDTHGERQIGIKVTIRYIAEK